MTDPPVSLRTPRLLLRPWRESDREPFAAMNADPEVMEHFPSPLTRAESDALVDRIVERMDGCSYGLWALEESATGEFLGFTGLNPVPAEVVAASRTASVSEPMVEGAVEIGWRLARPAWGRGLATEAALAAARHAFDVVGLVGLASFTATSNVRSVAVMQRTGMRRVGEFDHPGVPTGSPLVHHVLYRLTPDDLTSTDAVGVRPVG